MLQWTRGLWYLCIFLAILNMLSSYIYYNHDFATETVWTAISAAVYKYSWGFIVGYICIGLIFRFGWFSSDVLNYPAWRILGKLSYSTFMLHSFVIQLIVMNVHQPIFTDVYKFVRKSYSNVIFIILFHQQFVLSISATILSILVGGFFTLSVELPIATVVKMLTGERISCVEDVMIDLREFPAPMTQNRNMQ